MYILSEKWKCRLYILHFSPKHLMDVYFLCLQPTYPCRLFPLHFFHSREICNRPIALSQTERADEVSIDLILWKHTDKNPLKPVLVQSPFFPLQSVYEKGSWAAQLFKLLTNLFLPKSYGIVSTPEQNTDTEWKKERGGWGVHSMDSKDTKGNWECWRLRMIKKRTKEETGEVGQQAQCWTSRNYLLWKQCCVCALSWLRAMMEEGGIKYECSPFYKYSIEILIVFHF